MSKAGQWISGINAVASALEHDIEHVREILVEAGNKNARITEIEENARRKEISVRRVNNQALEGIAGGLRHQGVIARYEAPVQTSEAELPALIEAANGHVLILVLDGIQDPHNLGACLRSSAAANVTAVIIPKDKAAPITATVRKVSAGAADRIPVISVTNLARSLRAIKDAGVWVYGLDGEATSTIYQTDFKGNVAIVMGSEGEGMRRLTREHCDGLVKIPMPGEMESLNVSVATGVALFEVARQRLGVA